MNLQNQRRLFANGARIIVDRGFVGCADFAERSAAGVQDFANSKSSPDLDELAAGYENFVFRRNSPLPWGFGATRKMANDQNQRGGAVVYDRGCLGLAQDR